MNFKITLIVVFCVSVIRADINEKCCKQGHNLVEKNSMFLCEVNLNQRIQSNFEKNEFLSRNISGTCVDIYSEKKAAIFSVTNGAKLISKNADVKENFFSKCCHLGYLYNETLHSCTKRENGNHVEKSLKKNSFITIGLPACEIISDHIFNSMLEVETQLGKKSNQEEHCVDSTLDGKFILRICEKNLDICEKVRCIHKCCPDGQSFVNGSNCFDTFTHGINLQLTDRIESPNDPFAIIHGMEKPIYRLRDDRYNFSVDSKGVFASYMNKTESFKYYDVSEKSYCIDHAYKKGVVDGYSMFAGQVKQKLELKFAVTRWVKIVSCVFLLLTIAVYFLLPKMRNLFGKILLSYSIATFMFFFFLSFSQFYFNEFNNGMCRFVGFCSVLASIWSFTWLHIMCIDIWVSFGTPRATAGNLQKNEWKRLLQYSLYGWGFPIVWVLLIVFFSLVPILPKVIQPSVGNKKCYLENYDSDSGNYAYLLFITLPLLIQQIVNTVFFVKTIMYCLKIKAEIQKMNDTTKQHELNAGKERLALIMKLAVIMGVSFLFETISSLYNFQNTPVTTYIEVVWDTINCLQGVFIFIIFICKKKVYNSLCEKIPVLKSRKISVSSNTTTQVSMQYIGNSKREKTP